MRAVLRGVVAPMGVALAVSSWLGACAEPGSVEEPAAIEVDSAVVDGAQPSTVTLITGDRVRLVPGADGRTAVEVVPGPGREDTRFFQRRRGQGADETIQVVPRDAVPFLASGQLDPALFDVTALARRRDDGVRVIVRHARGKAAALARSAVAGRPLPSVGATAVAETADQAGATWAMLAGGARSLAPAIERISLDRVYTPVLHHSAVQVGAPAAWAAGFDGDGATVAVLDTGVDASHPDLAGQIHAARDFTGTDPAAGDTVGHGTHVASIIAGTGEASGGVFRGIAPGADLVIGKVCADRECYESDVIAGMEWAAASAPVVNLSLGAPAVGEADLVELAVDALSAQHGTLFVISAGNFGPRSLLGSPGTADAALTVGSVDPLDGMSDFSSRGPRGRDGALKPDLVAPGEMIIAARAAGTLPDDALDEHYAFLTGTSMAAPHVAGAAAILAAAHPDWDGGRIKAALMGSAADAVVAPVVARGAGRLDVTAALATAAHASPPSVSFDVVPWPQDQAPAARTIALHNDSDVEQTLDVTIEAQGPDGGAVPDGMFTVAPARVVIPPRGARDVVMTARPTPGAEGFHGGWLRATGGSTRLVVPFGVRQDPHVVDVTVQLIGRDGAPGSLADVSFTDRESTRWYNAWDFDEEGRTTLRMRVGRYSQSSWLDSPEPDAPGVIAATVFIDGEIVVDHDMTVVLDAREARRVNATVERPDAEMTSQGIYWDVRDSEELAYSGGFAVRAGTLLYVTPAAEAPGQDITVARSFALEGRDGATGRPYRYQLAYFDRDGIPGDVAESVRDRDLARVEAVYRLPDGTPPLWREVHALMDDTLVGAWSPLRKITVPRAETVFYTADPRIRWSTTVHALDLEADRFEAVNRSRRFSRGWYLDDWFRPGFGPGFPPEVEQRRATHHDNGALSLRVFPLSPVGTFVQPPYQLGTLTVRRDGELVGTSEGTAAYVYVPPERATYTAEVALRHRPLWSSFESDVRATWTFTSEQPDQGSRALPMLVVRATTDVDDRGAAPAGGLHLLQLEVERVQPGAAPVSRLELEVSLDEGATWRSAPVLRVGDHAVALVRHPDTGFVSLRTRAVDADGNGVEQTVVRAYRVR
jgi:subtilisin family serine protease